jgi:precorrin-2 dehydrogenase/sirohydrochlorin ferrochelatase
MKEYHPIAIRLNDKLVVIIGGGHVAERKALSLLMAGSRILVVSPVITTKLKSLVKKGKIEWRKGFAKKQDLEGASLVVAATSDKRANENISRWAHQQKIWVNVVDKPILSDFISPAVLRDQNAIIAVYTNGRDPVLSRDLKNFVKEHWDEFLSYRDGLQKCAS